MNSKAHGAWHFAAAALVWGGATASAAHAATYQTVALPSEALNTTIVGWSDGATYAPLFAAGSGTAAGTDVPFVFSQNASGNNVLFEYDAVDVPVGLSGVATVYTLMNTAFGAAGTKVGSLTFSFASGEQYSVDLIEGLNIRDHYLGDYVNTVSDASVTLNAFGSPDAYRAHIDMQAFAVPVAYQALTLSKLTFSSTHAGTAGQPFLAAVTVSQVPETDTSMMALTGLAIAAGFLARRRALMTRS